MKRTYEFVIFTILIAFNSIIAWKIEEKYRRKLRLLGLILSYIDGKIKDECGALEKLSN
jgi:hypothetical protein